jgi:predicted Zn-dependent protease
MINKIATFLLLTICLNSVSIASESFDFQLKALVRNGELSEAKKILNKLDKESELYFRIQGQILTKEEKYKEANALLSKAYEMSKKDQTLFIMAQNSLKLKKPQETVKLLRQVKKDSVPVRLMLSQAFWDLNQKTKAVDTVFKKGFSENELLERQKYHFLIKQSQIKKLFSQVTVFLKLNPNKVEPVLYATALLKEKDIFLSEKLFDLAIVASPKSALLLKERGAFELELNRPKVASHYFVRAAHLNKEYSYEASVTKLLLGEHYEALYHALNILDPIKRTKQKFFIYLDQERFEEVVSLREQLVRLNLFREEKITYAFLYSAYRVKDVESFNDVFSSYQLKSQLSKVMKLKELLEQCSKSMELECVFS